MWKLLGRGKRAVGARPQDRGRASTRCAGCVDSRRRARSRTSGPGTLERLGLGPVELLERNPGLVILRVTGFGQDGPYAGRPGFATMAEAMSGFAAINGEPDGAPLLPPIALTDEVTALAGAFTVMVALRHRDRTGEGQVVDVNLLETMLQLMGALPSANAHLGYLQPRLGSGHPVHRPARHLPVRATGGGSRSRRRPSRSRDRVMELLGVGDDPRFATFEGRVEHRDGARRDRRRLGRAPGRRPRCSPRSRRPQAAIAPVYSMADLLADPAHRGARGDRRGRRRADAGPARPALADARARSVTPAGRSVPTPTRCSPSSTSWADGPGRETPRGGSE